MKEDERFIGEKHEIISSHNFHYYYTIPLVAKLEKFIRKFAKYANMERKYSSLYRVIVFILGMIFGFFLIQIVNFGMPALWKLIGHQIKNFYFKISLYHILVSGIVYLVIPYKINIIISIIVLVLCCIIYGKWHFIDNWLYKGFISILISEEIVILNIVFQVIQGNLLFWRLIRKKIKTNISVLTRKVNRKRLANKSFCDKCNQQITDYLYILICNAEHVFHKDCLLSLYGCLENCPLCEKLKIQHNIFWIPKENMLIDLTNKLFINFGSNNNNRNLTMNSKIFFDLGNPLKNQLFFVNNKQQVLKALIGNKREIEFIGNCPYDSIRKLDNYAKYRKSVYFYSIINFIDFIKYEIDKNRWTLIPGFQHFLFKIVIANCSHYLICIASHKICLFDLLDEEAGWVTIKNFVNPFQLDSFAIFDIGNNQCLIQHFDNNHALVSNIICLYNNNNNEIIQDCSENVQLLRETLREKLPFKGVIIDTSNISGIRFYYPKKKQIISFHYQT